jgi:hypothetical protein
VKPNRLDLIVWMLMIVLIVAEFILFVIPLWPTILVTTTAWEGGVTFRGLLKTAQQD